MTGPTVSTDAISIGLLGGWTQEEATTQLRWNDGVLQQLWSIMEFDGVGRVTGQKREWRPIPTAADEPT